MQKIGNKVGYFAAKIKRRRREIERKLLEIDPNDIERRLETAGAVEVFRGIVISHYYGIKEQDEGLEFLSHIFGLRVEDIVVGSGGAFSRLREMYDDDGTKIYCFETRINEVRVGNLATTADVGDVCSLSAYRSLEGLHRDHPALEHREREVKKRLTCILPEYDGLEYALDIITEPERVQPYLEIEVSGADPSFELLIEGTRRLDLDPSKLVNISARRLIEEAKKNREAQEHQK